MLRLLERRVQVAARRAAIAITATPCVRPRSSTVDVPLVAANSVGIASTAVASTSIVAFSAGAWRDRTSRRPLRQPARRAATAPRISSTLPITEPMIDARATSSSALADRQDHDDHLGEVPERRVEEGGEPRAGRLAGLLGGDAQHPRQAGHGDAGGDEHHHRRDARDAQGDGADRDQARSPRRCVPLFASRPPGRCRGCIARHRSGARRRTDPASLRRVRVLLTNDDGIGSPRPDRGARRPLAPRRRDGRDRAGRRTRARVARSITLRRAMTVTSIDLAGRGGGLRGRRHAGRLRALRGARPRRRRLRRRRLRRQPRPQPRRRRHVLRHRRGGAGGRAARACRRSRCRRARSTAGSASWPAPGSTSSAGARFTARLLQTVLRARPAAGPAAERQRARRAPTGRADRRASGRRIYRDSLDARSTTAGARRSTASTAPTTTTTSSRAATSRRSPTG